MIIENYQEQRAIEEVSAKSFSFATVGAVYSDGISLIFPGETEASQKHYKYNKSATFKVNDRVYIVKDSGTYIVICPI